MIGEASIRIRFRYSVVLVMLFFGFCQYVSGQKMFIINLRAELYDTQNACSLDDVKYALVPQKYLQDSSRVLIQESWGSFANDISSADFRQEIEGKVIAVCIHGMAKSYAGANKDLVNNYWNLSKECADYYDIIIGINWPGESQLGASSYFKANKQANICGGLLGQVLEQWNAKSTDVITHSMGAKVLMRALNTSEIKFDHAFLLAPSILRNSIRPGHKWGKECKSIKTLVAFHSQHDFAFNWSIMQHMGLGYRGTKSFKEKKMPYYYQVNCSAVINQRKFIQLPKNAFRSRSNHSMYNQSSSVFRMISGVLNGTLTCPTHSCELIEVLHEASEISNAN